LIIQKRALPVIQLALCGAPRKVEIGIVLARGDLLNARETAASQSLMSPLNGKLEEFARTSKSNDRGGSAILSESPREWPGKSRKCHLNERYFVSGNEIHQNEVSPGILVQHRPERTCWVTT
jgi:hypothetical protein